MGFTFVFLNGFVIHYYYPIYNLISLPVASVEKKTSKKYTPLDSERVSLLAE